MIVLVGFMGAGKTTVGRLLADRLGLPFLDTDTLVEETAGKTVPAIFESGGEDVFRALERTAAARALSGAAAVVALGGGALADPDTLAGLGDATVVHLDVSIEEALRRVGDGANRPMLGRTDPQSLHLERARLYDFASDIRVATDGLTPETVAAELADAVAGVAGASPPDEAEAAAPASGTRTVPASGTRTVPASGSRTVPVAASGGAYDVFVGSDLAGRAGDFIPALADTDKAFIVTHPSLAALTEGALKSLDAAGLEVDVAFAPEGESSKSLDVASALFDWLSRSRAHRSDLVVAVGGGVVCDLAGFVASTYARGMPVVHIPTTLLAQVDAAIGGKTAVNLSHGKNLVGTFHQPAAVICDVGLLASLPLDEMRSGLAEVVKYGLIADPELLSMVESEGGALLEAHSAHVPHPAITDVVERSVAIKASFVAQDERDRGVRAHLNYGHTFAHAIEATATPEWGGIRHGEAVALGMMAAAYLAEDMGRLSPEEVAVHRRALEAVGLPVRREFDLETLEAAWQLDKKYRRGARFVLLNGIGAPEAGVSVPRDSLRRSLERMAG